MQIYFVLFNMRHPVYVYFPGPPYSLSRVVFCQLTAFTFSTSFIKLGAWATAKFINSFDAMAHWEFPKIKWVQKNFQLACMLENYICFGQSGFLTLPVKMFGPFWSVWYQMALAEVGVSLPWWGHTLVFLAPGYWRLFFKSHNFFIMEKCPVSEKF